MILYPHSLALKQKHMSSPTEFCGENRFPVFARVSANTSVFISTHPNPQAPTSNNPSGIASNSVCLLPKKTVYGDCASGNDIRLNLHSERLD